MALPGVYDIFNEKWCNQTVWIFSDPHFGDADIKKAYPDRPSDEELVKLINSKVGRKDTLILLGDIGDVEFAKQLRGYKVLIAGNHDAGMTNYAEAFKEMYPGALIIGEKLLTHGSQQAITEFEVDLYGENSSAHVVSRSVAQDESYQEFISRVYGNNCCSGHTECDAIVMNNAKVAAIPEIKANHTEASLIHEAAICKIAGEQLIKLMTLGLTEKEAEEQIISGFLK